MQPKVEAFFHEPTSTYSYVVGDAFSRAAAIIDPVLDFDPKAARTRTHSAERILQFVAGANLEVHWILETHAHADHLSAADYLKRGLGAFVGIGEGIRRVQATFQEVFNLGDDFAIDGSQFDRLFFEDERFALGELEVRVMNTPGHTNDSVSYVIGDAVFVGDTLFGADYGTARADFPGGDARKLFRSIQRIYGLPDATRVYLCHDYAPNDREPNPSSTIAEQKAANVHVHAGVTEEEFVAMRERRDASLAMPNLIIPSIQVNIRAGALPLPESNGVSYLKVPLNLLGAA